MRAALLPLREGVARSAGPLESGIPVESGKGRGWGAVGAGWWMLPGKGCLCAAGVGLG